MDDKEKPVTATDVTVDSTEKPTDTSDEVVVTPKPNSKKKWSWVSLVAVLVAAGLGYWFFIRDDEPQASINSYDECVATGYPVMESYPEQCAVPGGQTFTRELTEKEKNEQALVDAMAEARKSDLITELAESGNEISLARPGDEKKLPSNTPASFVNYMRQILIDNQPENGCETLYKITRLSNVNIEGGIGSINTTTLDRGSYDVDEDAGCGGGAHGYWYLKDGVWDLLGLQGSINCETLDETTIYSEFVQSCYDAELDKSDGDESYGNQPNPNGSIDDAKI